MNTMAPELMLIDRQAVQRELGRVFDRSTTRVLVNVLDRVAAQVHAAGVTRSDFHALQATMRELAAAQERTEATMRELAAAQARTEAALEKLAATQERTDERLGRLEEGQAALQKDVTVLQKGQAALQKGQAALQKGQAALQKGQASMQDTLGAVKGRQLELTYKERAGTYFGPLLRRVRVLSITQIEDDLEAHLSVEEFRDLLNLDLLVRGRPRHLPDAPQVWLAIEVSGVVDRHDVERAVRRAGHLSRAGYVSVPAVAGERVTEGARSLAQVEGVLLVLDGRTDFWERALERVFEVNN
ncbi:MAG: hypothetical protein ISS49_03535 [Anaerolineae bacterium]|nr:hypothetical protein [Anaerolineae bacterium]